jgi:hypothetical protein
MTEQALSQQVQWGSLTLLLDNEEFRKGYTWAGATTLRISTTSILSAPTR